MLLNFFQFRKNRDWNKIKTISLPENFFTEIYIRGYYHTSKDGYPVNIECFGKSNPKKF